MSITERLRAAAEHPDTQDHIGLLSDAANIVPQLVGVLMMARELLDDSDVRHFIGTNMGEQARLHDILNTSRKVMAIADAA